MLVRRRLSMAVELRDEYEIDVAVELVPSAANKADVAVRRPTTDVFRNVAFQAPLRCLAKTLFLSAVRFDGNASGC